MKKTENYKLGKIKQLIDLNGDITNFDLTFNVTSNDGSEFEAIVVDQVTLDNNPNIEYKKAPGTISGNIVADKNVYQNYFLLLKSDNPCDCTVNTELKSIPPNPNYVKENFGPKISGEKVLNKGVNNDKTDDKSSNKVDYKKILGVLVILGLCAFIYFKFFKKSKSNDDKADDKESVKGSVYGSPKASKHATPICSTVGTPVIKTPISVVKTPISVKTPVNLLNKKVNIDLLDKLKSLPSLKKT
jgi:hypothetical protein